MDFPGGIEAMIALRKIISGGQTGADQGGLRAGQELGLETGGWAPKDYRTESGDMPILLQSFGLQEHNSSNYAARTRQNVLWSDGTLIFGLITSTGSTLTQALCLEHSRPHFYCPWQRDSIAEILNASIQPEAFRAWLDGYKIKTLNVAGNRESTNPGIADAVCQFLTTSLKGHLSCAPQ